MQELTVTEPIARHSARHFMYVISVIFKTVYSVVTIILNLQVRKLVTWRYK